MAIRFRVLTPKSHNAYLRAYGEWPEDKTEALRVSIRKWKTIVTWMQKRPGELLLDGSTKTCALCMLYHDLPKCHSCPVAEAGYICCGGSPYSDWAGNQRYNPQAALGFAEQELTFLESLLPAKETKDVK